MIILHPGLRRLFLKRLLLAWLVIVTPGLHAAEIVFASYNLENYFVSERPSGNGNQILAAKSPKAIDAEISIITQVAPDILGVCEMGDPEDFADFKDRLKNLGFIDSEYVNGPDPDRHLALLSKFPIVARNSRENIGYDLNGTPEKVKRGFLDVTIRIEPGFEVRCVGVHLKSKLASPAGEALMRRHEAHLLRQHINQVLKESPGTRLLVYGDFNDTKNEPALQEIIGARGSREALKDLWLKDEQGDRWTYFWKQADTYSRIDYIMTSRTLFGSVVLDKSRIFRSPDWNLASDHRLISATLDTGRQP